MYNGTSGAYIYMHNYTSNSITNMFDVLGILYLVFSDLLNSLKGGDDQTVEM